MPAELKTIPATELTGYGYVHSIYRSTLNFTLNEELFSLQDARAECSPISFVLLQGLSLPLCRAGQPASWDGTTLRLGDAAFSCSHETERFSGELPAARNPVLPEGFALPALNGDFGGSRQSAAEAEAVTQRAAAAMACGNWKQAASELCGMLGLGCGLTPSGDDWLIGALALLQFAAEKNAACLQLLHAMQGALLPQLSETNDISARFLELACEKRFSAPVCTLFSAWLGGDAAAVCRAARRVLRLGHSSGADMLEGIRFMYNHLFC